MNGWGERRDLDFWTARSAGQVAPQEERAMTLLASISDERRFAFYARYGMYPALGNMSRRIYFVRRFETVLETRDGQPVASWCVVTSDRGTIPETDHVVALKNLIEGEELSFREIGNRGGSYWHGNAHEVVRTPFGRVPFKSPYFDGFMDEQGMDTFDPTRQKRQMETVRSQAIARRNELMRASFKKAPGYKEPKVSNPPLQFGSQNGPAAYFRAETLTDNSTASTGFSIQPAVNAGFFLGGAGPQLFDSLVAGRVAGTSGWAAAR